MAIIKIEGKEFSFGELESFISDNPVIKVAPSVNKRLEKGRRYVEKKLSSHEPYYGINTGFGMLASQRITPSDLSKLQENLIFSHAVGVGDPLPVPIVRLMMLLRINVLAMGYSGVRPLLLKLLVDMLNADITPIIPEQGSVGASGDLAPLAHLALALIGRGDVVYNGEVVSAVKALKSAGLSPIKLEAKEGIALINGTQAMVAMGIMTLAKLETLVKMADIVGALSIEGDRASSRPFDPRIQKLRLHPGQGRTAANILRLIKGSRIIESHTFCRRVQDAYSFRCIPQVHGAVKDVIAFAKGVILRETGSCTDNPLIFVDDDVILSGGNFHGEPLAFALDMIAIASCELGSISERRVAILTAPLAGELKSRFLVTNSGLNSGLMIPHVTMSALVSENKTLAHPASVDTIPTSGGQEDHVSMGMIAARKALTVVKNLEVILAIELFAACQAIDFQLVHGKPGKGTGAVHSLVRKSVPHIDADREFRYDIAECINLVRSGSVITAAEKASGRLDV